MLFAAQVVRKEAQKCCGWDLLTDGTGSDSRAWDQLQPAMALFLFPWVTSSITQDAPWYVTFRSWLVLVMFQAPSMLLISLSVKESNTWYL